MGDKTGRHDMQEMTLDLLKEIRDDLSAVKKEQARQGKQLERMAMDVNTVHKFQQSFTERLSLVEKFCVEQPLRTSPPDNGDRLGEGP